MMSYEDFASNWHTPDRSPSLTRDRSKVGSTATMYRFNILASISLSFRRFGTRDLVFDEAVPRQRDHLPPEKDPL